MDSRRWAGLLLAAALISPVLASDLSDRIDAFVAQPRFAHARWGIEVKSLDSGRVLYAHDADKLFVPASTNKLFTAALALDLLGADFRLPTRVFGPDPSAHGDVPGSIVLYGMGDPTLGAPASSADWANQMAVQMHSRGIRRIHGDLVADDTFFSTPPYGSGWEAEDLQARYGAGPSALSVGENAMQISVTPAALAGQPAQLQATPTGAVAQQDNRLITAAAGTPADVNLYRDTRSDTLHAFGSVPAGGATQRFNLAAGDSARVAGEALRAALQSQGIKLDGTVREVHWPQDSGSLRHHTTMLAEIESPALIDILRQGLKRSQNLYLQNLLLMSGVRAQATLAPPGGRTGFISTEDWGLIALQVLQERMGIPTGETRIQEGTGLARGDLVSPRAMNAVLTYLAAQPDAAAFKDTLPIAGVDGTLRSRMKGTPAEGRLQAKTGTLSLVRALAGYTTSATGERLVFTIFLNNYDPPTGAPAATADIDAVAVMLAGQNQL